MTYPFPMPHNIPCARSLATLPALSGPSKSYLKFFSTSRTTTGTNPAAHSGAVLPLFCIPGLTLFSAWESPASLASLLLVSLLDEAAPALTRGLNVRVGVVHWVPRKDAARVCERENQYVL